MRVSTLTLAIALAACAPQSGARSQGVSISIDLGPPRLVEVYSPDEFGPWRTAYVGWEPVTLYVVDGIYYEHPYRGARTVVVYRRGRDYFLPPRDAAWVGVDRRFDYKYRPQDWDYDHGTPHEKAHGRGEKEHGRGRGRERS